MLSEAGDGCCECCAEDCDCDDVDCGVGDLCCDAEDCSE